MHPAYRRVLQHIVGGVLRVEADSADFFPKFASDHWFMLTAPVVLFL